MELSAVNNLEISTRVLAVFEVFPLGSTSRIDDPSSGRSAKYFGGGQLDSLEYNSS